MPKPPLPDDAIAFLRLPQPAVMATVRPDGTPHSAATWYALLDDGRVLLNFASSRLRLGFLRKNPGVALTALDAETWYAHITLLGHVDEIRDDTDLADIDLLAQHYTGKPFRDRSRASVSALVAIDSWYGWDVRPATLAARA